MPRIVAGAGLLLVLAALMDTGRGVVDPLPAMRVSITVPQELLIVSGVIVMLSWILFMVAARRSRKLPEAPQHAQRRWSWWRQVLAQIAFLLPVIGTVVLFWLNLGGIADALLEFGRSWFGAGEAMRGDALDVPVITLPWLGWSVGLMTLTTALLMLTIAVLVLTSDRLIAWWLARDASARRQEVADAVDESLDDLGDDADARSAILRCYRRLEQIAARARAGRAPWQTADEFMHDLLGRLDLPQRPVERLTVLFQVARFSHHPLAVTDRDLARTCLEEIRADLDGRRRNPRGASAPFAQEV